MIGSRMIAGLALLLLACTGASGGQSRVHSVSADTPPPARDGFEAIMLSAHNDARDAAGVARLRWNDELADGARNWAETLTRDGKMRHSDRATREGIGENLWVGTANFFTFEHMIGVMVDESRDFRPGTFPEVSRTGKWQDVAHYTQIIWPTTEQVGCALATARGRDAMVCRYWPTGNIVGLPVG